MTGSWPKVLSCAYQPLDAPSRVMDLSYHFVVAAGVVPVTEVVRSADALICQQDPNILVGVHDRREINLARLDLRLQFRGDPT